jgi:hypothetical protein
LTIAPKAKSQNFGLSTTLTGTPAARAASEKRRASSSLSQAPMAIAAPAKSPGCQILRWIVTAPRGGSIASATISSHGSGA